PLQDLSIALFVGEIVYKYLSYANRDIHISLLHISFIFISICSSMLMDSSRVFFDLKSGRCSSVVEARLLRFWEVRNVKRGGSLSNHDASDDQFKPSPTIPGETHCRNNVFHMCTELPAHESSLLIRFKENTIFEEITDPYPPCPRKHFGFMIGLANTNIQLPESDIYLILYVDVIGEILGVKSISLV
ncbi:hypothetical protein HID58_046939, partial [Brassica napus]